MSKLKKRAEYEAEFALAALSEPRQRLHRLNRERVELSEKMRELTEQSRRLDAIVAAVGPARAALTALDESLRAALSAWAKGAEPCQPKVDAAKRSALVAALDDAEAAAESAKAVQAEMAAEIAAAGRRGNALQDEAERLSRVVVVEEMRTLLPQVIAARAEANRLAQVFADARAEIFRSVPYGDTSYNESASAFEKFQRELRFAEAPAPITPNGDSWRRFTEALKVDAAATFESAQSFELAPLPPAPPTLDPITAAARAVESFATNSVMRQ